ncbi:release factor glutamine methyltransferase [Planctomycetota bacterium]|nr:release factor glutamine methyltransferase [Planctomycetota bacterium]
MTADTPPRLLDLVQRSAVWLAERGITPPAQARREAEWIFAEALGLTRLDLYTRFDQPLDPGEVQRLRALVARRGRREPLAYIIGNQPFRRLTVHVGPSVLVPRPETEDLVTHALVDLPQGGRVVDIGTGSGAIALAIASERPDAIVTACDISAEALATAQANAKRLSLQVDFHQGDLGKGLPGGWDLIVANLPYIAESERSECDPELGFEPALALFAGADGLDLIRPLIADLPRLLAPQGVAWLEHGFRQGPAVRELAAAAGLVATTTRDHGDRDRCCRITRA